MKSDSQMELFDIAQLGTKPGSDNVGGKYGPLTPEQWDVLSNMCCDSPSGREILWALGEFFLRRVGCSEDV